MEPHLRGSGAGARRVRWPLIVWLALGTGLGWLWLVAWMPGGWLRDLLQGGDGGPAWREPDKWAHAAAAMALAVWFTLGWRLALARRSLALPAVVAGLVALTDEWLQLLAPDRSFDWGDLVASSIGVLLAMPLAALVARPAGSGQQVEQPASDARRGARRGQVQDQAHRGPDRA